MEMVPAIQKQAAAAFRYLDPESRQEAVAEVLANCAVAVARLAELGKLQIVYRTPLANFAIRQVRSGRRVGAKLNVHDLTSVHAKNMKQLVVERLDYFDEVDGVWKEILIEDRNATPAELAAFQRDFFAEDVLDGTLLDYVDQLRVAGYHLGLLSNMWDTARALFGQTYSLLVHFDSVTISGEEGFMKPDARIFRVALHRAGVRPDEAVLVDDFAVNVEGARQAGMRAVYFRTPQQALLELASMTGVTPALAAGE